jgi:bifunctional non-homologous end joining protein LigD
MNGADWSNPLVIRDAAKIKGSAIIDAEVVWLDPYGMSNFEALHSRVNDARASACAFDLLMREGDDLREKPYSERKAMLLKSLHAAAPGFSTSMEGIVSKKLDAPYQSGKSKTWIKIKNPKAPAATRAADGTF